MSDRSGPVKRWADMTPAERKAVLDAAKPPPRRRAILPYFECTHGVDGKPEDRNEDAGADDFDSPVRRARRQEAVGVEVSKLVHETINAELWEMDDGEQIWWPKSQIVDREIASDGTGTLWVTRFIAREKGIG